MTSTLLTMAVVVGIVAVFERWRPLVRAPLPWWKTLSEAANAVVFVAVSTGRTAVMTWFVLVVLVPFLRRHHLPVPVQPLVQLPLPAQFVVHFVVVDALDYVVHRLLHATRLGWLFHRVHHSIATDEMRGLASFRFHAGEIALYTLVQGAPLLFLAVDPKVALVVGVVQVVVGVVAHANVDVDVGVVSSVVVTPAFHRWHHAHDDEGPAANFGHCFAVWDVVCGTARRASAPPRRLGFAGDDRIVDHVVGHQLWPLVQRAPQRSAQQRKPVE